MTTVRDFDGPDRAPTLLVSPQPSTPAAMSPQSPSSPKLKRRRSGASVESNLSVPSSIDTLGARRRKPSRSNTVTKYHEPENVTESEHFQPGAEPGVDTSAEDDKLPAHLANLKADCDINIIDFSGENVSRVRCDNESLATALDIPRGDEYPCRWISVNGLSWDVIRTLGNKYKLHTLAIEDLIHTKTRTKVDWYADQAFIVLTFQKLVRMHQHRGRNAKCDCASGNSSEEEEEIDEKFEEYSKRKEASWRTLLKWLKPRQPDVLPTYLDRDGDGRIDEFVSAHSGLSEDTPIKPIRTLHRYESATIPEHTAWMEKHSALSDEDLAVSVEQVSIFLLNDNSVISFFEHSAADVEVPILERLHSKETILRRSCDASLVTQAIIDAIVDLAVPVRDAYNRSRKELQIDAMTSPNIRTSRALHIFGEEIDMLQNLFKPIVHLVNSLRDHGSGAPGMHDTAGASTGAMAPTPVSQPTHHGHNTSKRDREGAPMAVRMMSDYRKKSYARPVNTSSVSITPLAHMYFGDVLDHCITMISALEQMDASANNISTLIFNTVGARTNNFMMILAVVTVFFAPLTFISGYFGMNFASGSGLAHPFAFFWKISLPSLAGFMLLVFGFMGWDTVAPWLAAREIKASLNARKRAGKKRR
ncbi:Putative Mg2+ transporter protein, CorA-like/Zinc transport protein ZntB [Septoria linicola]|uniref:Mg2+ transporter protein, CorA-like/Zinc transport protein ZntB n=1 Tax=Septoria linicola TaxID=215465 RepID=A0A9Q9EFJ0_9PEZI|nr:putative Mg2+ transporter protein, CorA-like/Zinc transport protein ZntB [Septoria linicola]USW49816.1 Putative Mg2+ transporter protein, CorA-like/Zinc transport protein ZntB [Septoria linicola]